MVFVDDVERPFFMWDTAIALIPKDAYGGHVVLGTVTDVSKDFDRRSVWLVELEGEPFCLTITPEDKDGTRFLECSAINDVVAAAEEGQTVLSANPKIAKRLRDDGRAEVLEQDAAHLGGEVGAEQ